MDDRREMYINRIKRLKKRGTTVKILVPSHNN